MRMHIKQVTWVKVERDFVLEAVEPMVDEEAVTKVADKECINWHPCQDSGKRSPNGILPRTLIVRETTTEVSSNVSQTEASGFCLETVQIPAEPFHFPANINNQHTT